jgi:MEMO1 family protein
VSDPYPGGRVVCGALMPHAPILLPSVAERRQHDAVSTVSAMRKTARAIIAAAADALIVVSPHWPGISEPAGIWRGERLRGSLTLFGFPQLAIDLPADSLLADKIHMLCARRGLHTVSITECSLDHGAAVPLWFAAEAGVAILSRDRTIALQG